MLKAKNNILLITLMMTIFCLSAFLFSCGNSKPNVIISAGENGSIESYEKNGEKYYRATADDWFAFTGWYDGYRKYSDNPNLKITSKTPKKLEARFSTSGTLTFDRLLNSMYNIYSAGCEKQGDYFNFSLEGDLLYKNAENLTIFNKNTTLSGYLNENGREKLLSFKAGEQDNLKNVFAYLEENQEGKIYLDFENKKYCYGDLNLFSNLQNLLNSSEEAWNCEKLFQDSFYQFDRCFGLMNDYGFVESVENDKDTSSLTISFQKILNTLKNFYPSIKDEGLKQLANVLIGAYSEESFPKISIKLDIEYVENDSEKLKNIKMVCALSKDYHLTFGERIITLPKGEIFMNLNAFDCGFKEEPDDKFKEEVSSYPPYTHNALNYRVEGSIAFVSEGEMEQVKDKYDVSIDADLNPFALVSFKGKNYQDIDWSRLGFLSARITLNLDGLDEAEKKAQLTKHNNSTDYLNILIDSKRYGGKVLVYASFYDPKTLLSKAYFINNSFDLDGLFDLSKAEKRGDLNQRQNNIITDIIKTALELAENSDKENLNQTFFEIINKYLFENEEFKDCLSLQEDKIQVKLMPIREKLREIQIGNGLGTVKPDKYLFGDESISKLEIDFGEFKTNCVIKDETGKYYDKQGKSITDDFNQKHSTVIAIEKISELEKENYNDGEIEKLCGKVVSADRVILSDGNLSETYFANNGMQEKVKLKIIKVQTIQLENGKIVIKLALQIDAPLNKPNVLDINISDTFNNLLKMPYGLLYYSFETNLK